MLSNRLSLRKLMRADMLGCMLEINLTRTPLHGASLWPAARFEAPGVRQPILHVSSSYTPSSGKNPVYFTADLSLVDRLWYCILYEGPYAMLLATIGGLAACVICGRDTLGMYCPTLLNGGGPPARGKGCCCGGGGCCDKLPPTPAGIAEPGGVGLPLPKGAA